MRAFPPDFSLSPREREVVSLLAQGLTRRQIADRLDVGLNAVHGYAKMAAAKLDAESDQEAVERWKSAT